MKEHKRSSQNRTQSCNQTLRHLADWRRHGNPALSASQGLDWDTLRDARSPLPKRSAKTRFHTRVHVRSFQGKNPQEENTHKPFYGLEKERLQGSNSAVLKSLRERDAAPSFLHIPTNAPLT